MVLIKIHTQRCAILQGDVREILIYNLFKILNPVCLEMEVYTHWVQCINCPIKYLSTNATFTFKFTI